MLWLSSLHLEKGTQMARHLLGNDICIEPQGILGTFTSVDPLEHCVEGRNKVCRSFSACVGQSCGSGWWTV